MSPLDSGFPREPGPKKRMLPAVTDVVRELAKVVSADPAVLFKTARSVVAEELAKVKQGFEAAPLGVLVKRARLQLTQDGEATPDSEPAPPSTPVFRARPAPSPLTPGFSSPRAGSVSARPAAPDEPFQDLASRAELNWEREIPIQPPFRSAVMPIQNEASGPLEISSPIDAPPRAAPEPQSAPVPTPAPKPQPELELDFAPPPAPAKPEPPAPKPRPAPPEPAPEEPMPRPAVVSAPAVPLVNPREAEMATPREPEMATRREVFEGDDGAGPAMEEFRFKAAERPAPAPTRSSRAGWLVALAGVLAIGAALTWAVRDYVFRGEIGRRSAPAARQEPEGAPPVSAALPPSPTAAPSPVTKPASPSPKAASVPARQAVAGPRSGAVVPKGRAALLLTPDWVGRPTVYVVHFSSHRDRESATKEAQKLAAALGAPGHAVEVDLGEKGIWYRVVIGEFADVDAARAFRADLESKKTPGMGFVYEMRGR